LLGPVCLFLHESINMFLLNKKKQNTGFTLIELLVVISIISLLTSIVLSALSDAKAKARDVRRMQDLAQIRNAVELYINDHGTPVGGNGWLIAINSSCSLTHTWIVEQLSPKYISTLPEDPLSPYQSNSCDPGVGVNNYNQYWYYYANDYLLQNNSIVNRGGSSYFICSKMEKTKKNIQMGSWGYVDYCVGSN